MLLDVHTLTFCEQVLGEIYPPPPKWQLRKLCHDDDSLAQEHFVLNVRTFDDRPQPVPARVSDKCLLHNKNFAHANHCWSRHKDTTCKYTTCKDTTCIGRGLMAVGEKVQSYALTLADN